VALDMELDSKSMGNLATIDDFCEKDEIVLMAMGNAT
jgi:hypothetical protein